MDDAREPHPLQPGLRTGVAAQSAPVTQGVALGGGRGGALNQPDIGTPWGLRDRAILETLYSTGIRRMELTRLTLYDVDLAAGTVMVRLGKGPRIG
ncbi:MAG: tyrosine-type recombinase/integrase [Zoogloeaceae bacterium]|nr:tyrosine-type recombinase/integrase [Zoogloeaceae bacterium]